MVLFFSVGGPEAERRREAVVQRTVFSGGHGMLTLHSQDRCSVIPAVPPARTSGPG